MRIQRLDENLRSFDKPQLTTVDHIKLNSDDSIVVCAGFEDRATALLEKAFNNKNINFKIILIDYRPFVTQNQLSNVRALCNKANKDPIELIYDRENPSGFGDHLLDALQSVTGRVFIDVSAMSRLLIVQSLTAIRHRACKFSNIYIFYAEAETYSPTESEFEDAYKNNTESFTFKPFLSTGVYDIAIVPELSATSIGMDQNFLIAFPTFSPEQLLCLRNELSPSQILYIHGTPPAPENQWRLEAIAKINQLSVSSTESTLLSTFKYEDTLNFLLDFYSKHSFRERIIISPTGSKLQTVAVGLLRSIIKDIQIVYPTPSLFSNPINYTRGVKKTYLLDLSPFSSF